MLDAAVKGRWVARNVLHIAADRENLIARGTSAISMRDLSRARQAVKKDLQGKRQQISH